MGIHVLRWLVLAASIWAAHCQKGQAKKPGNPKNSCPDSCSKDTETLKKALADLTKQVMMQQTAAEERARLEGYSGIHTIRGTKRGPRNYDYAAHVSAGAMGIHDHSNYRNTLGLGELTATINGVTFRTRHNDYKLMKPSTTSKKYHEYEEIAFPEVPPSVLSQPTIKGQITEMQKYFEAFQNEDKELRDYVKYFKWVFCYMEGNWKAGTELEEPFPSDRHSLDAKTPEELDKKNEFSVKTGAKNRLENIAFLPTTISYINKVTGFPEYARWSYRITCHEVNKDIKKSFLVQQDDLLYRQATGQTLEEVGRTRAARFKLMDPNRATSFFQLEDEIFKDIPGKNNYGSHINFTVFGEPTYEVYDTDSFVPLNAANYHRSYRSSLNGAGGISQAQLGFNDANMYVALTDQPEVAPFQTDICWLITNEFKKLATRCRPGELRVSYAIPLELIVLTPLLSWNPYNLAHYEDFITSGKGGRNGNPGPHEAFNGTDKTHYYRTPTEFYQGNVDRSDPADTVRNYVNVLDPQGKPQKVRASGISVFLPEIQGISTFRMRYPIAPVSGEGSSVWKEVNALRDLVESGGADTGSTVQFEMSETLMDPPGKHSHTFSISYDDYGYLQGGEPVNVTTDQAQTHTHELTIVYNHKEKKFMYTLCDGAPVCRDGHGTTVFQKTFPDK